MMEAERHTNDERINKALESDRLLTVIEFVAVTGMQIDTFMISKFWAGLREDRLIYVDDELICWMGYSGAEAYHRKMAFMKLLSCSEYKYLSHYQYKTFLAENANSGYPSLPTGKGSGSTKHILVNQRTLKTCIMKLGTARGDRVREYYADLEELFRLYVLYQARYAARTYEAEITKLKSLCTEYTRACAVKEFDSTVSPKVGCVYFIRCQDRVKIGYTYDLPARMNEIQVCCPHEIELVRSLFSDYPAELEVEMHRRFTESRKIGEWFELSDSEILAIEEH